MYNGLNALTRRTFGVIAVGLALAANTASADFLFAVSHANDVNNLKVDDSIALYSGENQGWRSSTFPNELSNFQYFVGDLTYKGHHFINNFFIFDISDLTAPVSSAVLNLQFYTAFSSTGAASLTYSLFDVSTNLEFLKTHTEPSLAILNDLGGGTSYGSFSISTSLGETDVVHLTLNSAGLADLNAAIAGDARQFAIGGTLYPVPDSGNTLVLFGLAAAGIWSLRNRTRAA